MDNYKLILSKYFNFINVKYVSLLLIKNLIHIKHKYIYKIHAYMSNYVVK